MPGRARRTSGCGPPRTTRSSGSSAFGREVTREIDPWPYSEAGRFHRGIACLVALIGILFPSFMLVAARSAASVLLLAATAVAAAAVSVPLMRHLWHSPSGFPDHIPQSTVYEPPVDQYSTQWNSWDRSEPTSRLPRGEFP